ncbi:hypothetical protein BESB_065870 [Besnoitia besnoiti]|uniref:Magnesium transporter NIPA n=1 Tax=Besnoitia besnoiti TaxID=94643 RepID=A0A2A9MBF8_BESBE|nr:hypothetical protein BESB_065870 [Besnoitia besnoiti]PFH34554.1 hypothetical protein BESB_065870 [Besnoitia besnoiti]
MSGTDEHTQSYLWWVGVGIVFVGSLAGAVGDTMVRHVYVMAGEAFTPKQMLRCPMFVAGMLLTVVLDPFCTFLSLLFAPSSIVTPFAGVHIFWAVMIAHFWLKEHLGGWEKIGSFGIVTGVILMVVFSGKEANIGSIDAFDSYAQSAGAIAYIVVSFMILIVILDLAFAFYPCSLGSSEYSVRRLATSLASGFLGGNANVAAKFFSIIVMDLFSGNTSVFGNWRTYVVTLGVCCVGLGQLFFLNLALRRYEAVYVVPTINSCLVAEGTIGSILVLHEIPGNWIAFSFGLFMCIAGILILTTMHTVQPSALEAKPSREPAAIESAVLSERQESKGLETAERYATRKLETLTRSFSRSATAVAEMAVILNPKAMYSMYTMQENRPFDQTTQLPAVEDNSTPADSSCGSSAGVGSPRSSAAGLRSSGSRRDSDTAFAPRFSPVPPPPPRGPHALGPVPAPVQPPPRICVTPEQP